MHSRKKITTEEIRKAIFISNNTRRVLFEKNIETKEVILDLLDSDIPTKITSSLLEMLAEKINDTGIK
jgi:hypothetical protein